MGEETILQRDPQLPLWQPASSQRTEATLLSFTEQKAKKVASPLKPSKPLPTGCCEFVDSAEIHPVVEGHLCKVSRIYCPPSVYANPAVYKTCEVRAAARIGGKR